MFNFDFSDARIKFERARKHISDLEKEIDRFLASEFFHLKSEYIAAEGTVQLVLDSLHQPNKEINAIFGDAIGCLRSCLDYIAVAMCSDKSGNSDQIYFPFADDDKGFAGQCKTDRLTLSPQLLGLFIDQVQAYQGGKGHSFWVLNKLRNIDKHRFLLATVENAGFCASWVDNKGNVFNDVAISGPAGKRLNAVVAPVGYNLKFTVNPQPVFEVRVHEPPFVDGVEIVPFLTDTAVDIARLLNLLEGFPRAVHSVDPS